MAKKRGRTEASPRSSTQISRPSRNSPVILLGCGPRYNSLSSCKVKKPERGFRFSTIPHYDLDTVFADGGMNGWVGIWNSKYCDELVLSFLAHLTYQKESQTFTSTVQGTHIQFTTPQLCDELQLPTTGIDPYAEYTAAEFSRDEALKTVLGGRYDEERRKKLYRSQLPHLQQLLSYILHFNVMPRGGMAHDEVPNAHLRFIYGILIGHPVDFSKILSEVFTRLADKNVKFVGYSKLITRVLLNHGVVHGDWSLCDGETINRKKLIALKLPERPTDDQMVESDASDSDDRDIESLLRRSRRLQSLPSSGSAALVETDGVDAPTDADDLSWSAPTGSLEVYLGQMEERLYARHEMQLSRLEERLNSRLSEERQHYKETVKDVKSAVERIESRLDYIAWQQRIELRLNSLEQVVRAHSSSYRNTPGPSTSGPS